MNGYERGRAWIELDRAALEKNLSCLQSLLPPGCRLMPALKANAYGHGAYLIGRELARQGIDCFCTATAREGAALREQGIWGDILVLGYTHPEELELVESRGLIQTVPDLSYAEMLAERRPHIRLHLAIDTGMHRLGAEPKELAALAKICHKGKLRPEGAYTHLCTGDKAFSCLQAERFSQAVNALKKRGLNLKKTHLLSSGSLLSFPELGGDYARVGIALYGLMSRREETAGRAAALCPVLSLKARVAAVRELAAGEGAGYGLCFRAGRPTQLAVLSIGYADGLPASLSEGRGRVLINGRQAPIVGRICMDQTLVDVTEAGKVCAGDEAVLIGESGGQRLSAYDMAEAAGTITNEIVSRLGERLTRVML